ncbi:uncharacterized protein LOC130717768 [Lotus japonicus]|uniref:uncharacterized protein LOC130717768 n=1 Tax=Lotus japonicus TaxID=34305 RepID=UPI0025879860|nr:uncharacterized protein LOC130717768 [Lotus japonicus]
MSAMEKHVAQIFDTTKRIIDQARHDCHLWEHHLFPKLLLNGILPPPWLCNSTLHPLASDPKDLNKDDLVSEVPLSQPQFRVAFPGYKCSLSSNLDVVRDCVQYPVGSHNEVPALVKDCYPGEGLSNLPECSVNNTGCASSGPAQLDCGAISPHNQRDPTVADSYHEPALSMAKLQRSKSRQKALEQRNSAKAPKRLSVYDNNNAGESAGAVAGSASPTREEGHIKESDTVKDFQSNIQICSMEEGRRGDGQTPKEKSNYSGRITRSESFSQKFDSLNVTSSIVKEDGLPPNNLDEALEIVNPPCFISGSCGAQEANKAGYQSKEAGSTEYDKRLTTSGNSSQARHHRELLKRDSTSARDKGVEACDLMLPNTTHIELTNLSKSSDRNSGSRRNSVEDGDFCDSKQENDIHSRRRLLRSSCSSPGNDFIITDGSVKSINKSVQSPQHLVSQNLQDPSVPVVGSFSSPKDPELCAVKSKERTSRSGSVKVSSTRGSKLLKSLGSNLSEQNATCSEPAGEKSQNVRPTEQGARRLSSSPKYSKIDIEVAMDSLEKENVAALSATKYTTAVTTCIDEGLLRPVSSSTLGGGSLLAESPNIETAVAEKVLDAQENMMLGANPTGIAEHRSDATAAKVDTDFDGFFEKGPPCLGSRLTTGNPMVEPDVPVLSLPSDFVMSMMPKQLDFDDVEEMRMDGIPSPDLEDGPQGRLPGKEPLTLLEPLNLLDEETQEMQEDLIREERPQVKCHASHFNEADMARRAQNAMSPNKELPMVEKIMYTPKSSMSHSSASQVAPENSSGSLSKEVMADSFSEGVTGIGLPKYTDKNNTNITAGFPFTDPMDELNVGLAQRSPNSISLRQNGDLLKQASLSEGKITGFSADFQIFRSSTESSTYDVEHSWPQHKRRKVETEREKFLHASSNLLDKPLDSIDQRHVSRKLSVEEVNPEAVLEVQHLPSDQEDDIGHQYSSNNSLTGEMQNTRERQTIEGSSCKVRKDEKLILDGGDRIADTLKLAEANPSFCSVDPTRCSSIHEMAELTHRQVNSEHGSGENPSCIERSASSRRVYPGGNAEFSDCLSVSSGIRCLDLIDSDEAVPEFEGFIMQTDNAQPCTAGDQVELERMDLPINSIDYASLSQSMSTHSPLSYSSTPYKLHDMTDLFQSVPNGLLEGFGLRNSIPLNDGSRRALSDCVPNRQGQYTCSVQTLWDRINSNHGSSGKRKSLKSELPCISEENENVDEIEGTFDKGIGLEGMTGSITREPLTEIIDNSNPSTSVVQDNILTGGHVDLVSTEFSFSGTQTKVKRKLGEQDGNRRFTRKAKENQSLSFGANGAKRTTPSMHKRSSRPKLSGKDSLRRQGAPNSEVKSARKNIVSNITSFIPLVQQKQAAAVITGKRDIKVKALETAEAAKRLAEKKENERKMKKEAWKIERERMEQQKKDEERKKKQAEMAAKKRQREDEEKKEKERKRKQPQEEHKKIHSKKEELEIQRRATVNAENVSETEPLSIRDSVYDKTKESCLELSESVHDCATNGKVMGNFVKATEDSQELSYEMSPYKGSDDEDEDEDIPNNKFIPSWASRHSLFLSVSSEKRDPERIFSLRSFCDIDTVTGASEAPKK